MYGPTRLLDELRREGYLTAELRQAGGQDFALVLDFEVPVGRFIGRRVDLGLPATPDFPRSVGAALHIRANPHLVDFGSVPERRNVQESALGHDWQYWSHRLMDAWWPEVPNPGARLMRHVHTIFDRI